MSIAVVDNDVLIKAARYGQAVPLLEELRRRHATVYVQPSLAQSCDLEGRTGVLSGKFRETGQRDALRAAVQAIPKLSLPPAAIEELPHIPRGGRVQTEDALWIAYVTVVPEATIYTGDKRALLAVGTDPALARIADKLRGRCALLQELLIALITRNGVHAVRNGMAADVALDPGISAFLPAGPKTPQVDLLRLMNDYLASCHAETRGVSRLPP